MLIFNKFKIPLYLLIILIIFVGLLGIGCVSNKFYTCSSEPRTTPSCCFAGIGIGLYRVINPQYEFWVGEDEYVYCTYLWDYFWGRREGRLNIEIWNPQNFHFLPFSDGTNINSTGNFWWRRFTVKDLWDEGGGGRWEAKWYLSDQFIGSSYFFIYSKSPKIANPPPVAQPSSDGFFFCCAYIDKDQDGYWSSDHFVGIKDDFRVGLDENIYFVSEWKNKKNMRLRLEIYDPIRRLWDSDTTTSNWVNFRWWPHDDIRKMYNERSEGVWQAKWFLEGTCVQTKTFTIRD